METSRAVVVKKFGSYDGLSVEQFQLEPLQGRIEVKVEYGGLNFADLYSRKGLMPHKLPFVLGMECTGVITAIGVENSGFTVGQRVICYDYKCGLYRDTVRVTPDKCYLLPDHVTFEEGAAIFVNYLTAYFSVIELGNLKKNETVLILSCAGGVGWAATQLSKTIEGVTVVGTTSSVEKHPEVEKNGVDITLLLDENFKNNLKEQCPEGFDLILSTYAGPLYEFLETQLKPLGRIVLIGANNLINDDKKLSFLTLFKGWWTTKNVSLQELIVKNRVAAGLHLGTLIDCDPERVRNALKRIFEMMQEKKLKAKIDSVHSMGDIVEATKLLAGRKNCGKVLISMKEKGDL